VWVARPSDRGANDASGNRAGKQRYKDFQEALDQDIALHTQDAANDDAADKQVEEVRPLGKVGDRLDHRHRKQMRVDQVGWQEGRDDRGASDIAKDRDVLTYLCADIGAQRK
jgi:hypothetical protein